MYELSDGRLSQVILKLNCELKESWMVPHFTDTEVAACFQELIGSRVNVDLYKEIIDKFVPVKF
jgi:hypothetical protein